MHIPQPLLEGTLLRRYKRFLADVELADGSVVTAHTPNPGRMIGCSEPGSRVWLRDSEDPKRKLRHTLQTVDAGGALVNVDTGLPNAVVEEAVRAGSVAELEGFESLRREVKYGTSSRIDLLLEGPGRCFVEVKSVTLAQDGVGLFPDAVTARGLKHLDELARVVEEGDRGVIFFFVSRGDVERFAPADEIDSAYGEKLREVVARGVEALAYTSRVEPARIEIGERIPVDLETRVALEWTR